MRFLALLAALLLAVPAFGAGRVDAKNTQSVRGMAFTFDDTVSTGLFSAATPGCSQIRVGFEQATTGTVELHSVPLIDSPIGVDTLIAVFNGDVAEPGAYYAASGTYLRFNVTAAETAGDSVLFMRCSDFFADNFGPPPAPVAVALVTATPPATAPGQYQLDAFGSTCQGSCTYAWVETTGGGALCTAILDPAARATTAQPCSAGTSTFQVTVTNVTGVDADSDSDTIGAAPTGFPFNFPMIFTN